MSDNDAASSAGMSRNDDEAFSDRETLATKVEVHRKESTRCSSYLTTGLVYGLYLGLGILFYAFAESWSTLDTLYFAHVTMSTVGYGDLTPTTSGSQAFTLFYIIVGIMCVFTRMSTVVTAFTQPVFNRLHLVMEKWFPQEKIDIDGDGDYDFQVPRHPVVYFAKGLLLPLVLVLLLQLVFAALFVAVETDPAWNMWTAFYHCLVTATTVGYGDIPIDTDGGKLVAMGHILLSVASIGALMADVDTLREQRRIAQKRMRLLASSLDTTLITSLDTDGNGVDQFEFVIGMLTKLDLVSAEDVTPFVALFKSMDADGSGLLTHADLEVLANRMSDKAQAAHKAHAVASSLRASLRDVASLKDRSRAEEEPRKAQLRPSDSFHLHQRESAGLRRSLGAGGSRPGALGNKMMSSGV